ncbi:MAG: prepilin-type N-terminal cleavage/methylation domain-containing protein [Planctomycetota bacterium]
MNGRDERCHDRPRVVSRYGGIALARVARREWIAARGMTLLEVMLALALTCVVLATISMAIDLHLRMVDERRDEVERVQLARSVLRIVAQDLRATVEPCSTDYSVLTSIAGEAASGEGAERDGAEASGMDGGGMGEDESQLAGTSDDPLAEDASAVESGSIASSNEPLPVPGLYGNQYELQLDVSRIPRQDEMQRIIESSLETPLQDIPSDVKTVAYYVHDPDSGLSTGDFRDRAGNPQRGLVRRSLDRAVTLHAAGTASATSLEDVGEIIAPEIAAIEFQYYDGVEWLYEWDSETNGGLPVAVRVTIVMMPEDGDMEREAVGSYSSGSALPTSSSDTSVLSTESLLASDLAYSVVVRLPTAVPSELTEQTETEGMEALGF